MIKMIPRFNRTQYDFNVDRWNEVTAWFMDGPGRLVKKQKSEKISYDPDFMLNNNFNSEVSEEVPKKACSGTSSETSSETSEEVPEQAFSGASEEISTEAFSGAPEEILDIVSVISEDTFTAALNLISEKLNPLVLNMANAQNPGGGVYKGSIAQEEDLFRRSNYFQVVSLTEFYPIGELEVIYSPAVSVYKNQDFQHITNLTNLSCIACAAERNPKTIPNPEDPDNPYNRLYEDEHVIDITKKRITTIFQVAIKKKHDSLVLSGLGCGAFNNPQMRIIDFFNENIQKYRQFFKKIVFAVLSKKDPNYYLFSTYIKKKFEII